MPNTKHLFDDIYYLDADPEISPVFLHECKDRPNQHFLSPFIQIGNDISCEYCGRKYPPIKTLETMRGLKQLTSKPEDISDAMRQAKAIEFLQYNGKLSEATRKAIIKELNAKT